MSYSSGTSNRVELSAKLAGETKVYAFDFTSKLSPGASLSGTPTVTCTVYSGTDASPSSMISGAASLSGAIALQLITGGTLGVVYILKCTATASSGQTLILTGFLYIAPDLS